MANSIIKHREETEHRIEESGKEARAMIKTVQSEIDNLNRRIQVSKAQAKEESLRLEKIVAEEKKCLEDLLMSVDKEINNLQYQINSLSKDRETQDKICDAELSRIGKIFSTEEKTDRKKKDDLLETIDKESGRYTSEHDIRLKQLQKDEEAELMESGKLISICSTR